MVAPRAGPLPDDLSWGLVDKSPVEMCGQTGRRDRQEVNPGVVLEGVQDDVRAECTGGLHVVN